MCRASMQANTFKYVVVFFLLSLSHRILTTRSGTPVTDPVTYAHCQRQSRSLQASELRTAESVRHLPLIDLTHCDKHLCTFHYQTPY